MSWWESIARSWWHRGCCRVDRAAGAVFALPGCVGSFQRVHHPADQPHLLPFIAHDRAGFGGALMAVAIVLLGLWGWRQGEAWVWWTLLGAAAAASVSALAIHFFIHYTAFISQRISVAPCLLSR